MKKILIIDDDAGIREALRKVLRSEGYTPLVAAGAEEALERFEESNVDLILLDLNLPSKNGWDLFEHFTGANPLVPIIVITGRSAQDFLAAEAGVGALLEKPLDVDFLLKSIRELLVEKAEVRLRRLLGSNQSLRFAPAQAKRQKGSVAHKNRSW